MINLLDQNLYILEKTTQHVTLKKIFLLIFITDHNVHIIRHSTFVLWATHIATSPWKWIKFSLDYLVKSGTTNISIQTQSLHFCQYIAVTQFISHKGYVQTMLLVFTLILIVIYRGILVLTVSFSVHVVCPGDVVCIMFRQFISTALWVLYLWYHLICVTWWRSVPPQSYYLMPALLDVSLISTVHLRTNRYT